jgi:hypothetical protein
VLPPGAKSEDEVACCGNKDGGGALEEALLSAALDDAVEFRESSDFNDRLVDDIVVDDVLEPFSSPPKVILEQCSMYMFTPLTSDASGVSFTFSCSQCKKLIFRAAIEL